MMQSVGVAGLTMLLITATAFRPLIVAPKIQRTCLAMSDPSQVLAAQPTIEEWLDVADPALKKTMLAMFRSVKEISYKIRVGKFGEDGQEPIEITANNVIFANLQSCGAVSSASSAETTTIDNMGGKGYSVAFEPMEGSSVIDTNFAVGTIWGIWPGSTLTGIKGSEMRGAGVAVYGPRTTITLAIDNMDYSHEFLLVDDMSAMQGQWVKSDQYTKIKEGKLISPGNLRATQDNKGYQDLFNYWMQNTYQLRYTGGLVADVNQLMVKGKGVFSHVQSPATISELQLLYEVAPLAFLIEKAGGKSSDGEKSILDVVIEEVDQTSQVAYGSADEVKRFDDMVGVSKN
jgi:sedoheptulose-bisphosphatase